jgi:hypothetical protein
VEIKKYKKNGISLSALTSEVIDDFAKTSGFLLYTPRYPPGSVAIDPITILNILVPAILKQCMEFLEKRLKTRKENPNRITEEDIQELRELVLNFESQNHINQGRVLTKDTASKMADSVERVLRNHPEALIHFIKEKK